jgi:conjugative transfer region protein (TIGR03748 family)
MRQSSRLLGLAVLSAVMAEAILLSGCATSAAPPTSALQTTRPRCAPRFRSPRQLPLSPAASADLTPVVRYGRYTLSNWCPEPAQRDLMRQVVEVVIPPSLDTNVGDALRHVLRRSGYRLCDTADSAALYALPLPAAHLHLGPLMLRDALLTLAGPAWDVSIDDGCAPGVLQASCDTGPFRVPRPRPPHCPRTRPKVPIAGRFSHEPPANVSRRRRPSTLAEDRGRCLVGARERHRHCRQRGALAPDRTEPQQRTGCPDAGARHPRQRSRTSAEAAKRQPKPVVQGDFDAARQALEERLAHVEQAQAADAHGDDIKALQARVGVLEARLKKRAPSATAPRKTAERPSPKCPNRHSTWSVWSCAAANASCRSHRTAPWRLPTCGCCARVSRSVPGNSRPSRRMPSSSAWTTRPCASRCRRSVP